MGAGVFLDNSVKVAEDCCVATFIEELLVVLRQCDCPRFKGCGCRGAGYAGRKGAQSGEISQEQPPVLRLWPGEIDAH